MQVIERHIVSGLEDILSPVFASTLSDSAVQALVSEPVTNQNKRQHLEDQISKLKAGQEIFKGVM